MLFFIVEDTCNYEKLPAKCCT